MKVYIVGNEIDIPTKNKHILSSFPSGNEDVLGFETLEDADSCVGKIREMGKVVGTLSRSAAIFEMDIDARAINLEEDDDSSLPMSLRKKKNFYDVFKWDESKCDYVQQLDLPDPKIVFLISAEELKQDYIASIYLEKTKIEIPRRESSSSCRIL